MMRRYLTIIICLLSHNSAILADDREKTVHTAAPPVQSQWKQTSIAMLSRDYMQSADINRQIVQQELATYSSRALNRAGNYAPVAGVLGTAIGLAANDQRYSLNDSKTVGLMLKDSTSSRRSLMLEYRKDW